MKTFLEIDESAKLVKVCAWHSDALKAEAMIFAERIGFAVSHGMCDACMAREVPKALDELLENVPQVTQAIYDDVQAIIAVKHRRH